MNNSVAKLLDFFRESTHIGGSQRIQITALGAQYFRVSYSGGIDFRPVALQWLEV